MKDIALFVYAYLTDYLKLWLVLWGIADFHRMKNKNVICIIIILQVVLIPVMGLFNINYPDEIMFLRILLVIIISSIVFQGKFLKKLAYSLLAYILVLFLDTIIIGFSSLYSRITGYEISSNSIMILVYNAVNIFTIGLLVIIKKRRKHGGTFHLSKRIYALLFAGAATGVITLAALLVGSNNSTTESARKVMVIATIVVAVCYNAACLMIIIITESRDNYKALSLLGQNIIESQQQYYNLVNEKQQEMRSIRHEMKNHLACINSLYRSNKLNEMEQYIDQLVEATDAPSELFDTRNDIVNAILNDAQSKYKKNDIVLRLEGGFPERLYVAPMDLCIIFANVVLNAVEAILRMDREDASVSYIDIKISSYKEDLFVDIRNPVGDNVEIHRGKIPTSKADKSLHGFGIKNMVERVNKYQGTVNFQCSDNMFTVEIYMKNRA